MSVEKVPEDPTVVDMLGWIESRYNMSKAALARMFQTTQSTIHYWKKTGKISYKNLMKLRASFYYLNNSTDPHAKERKCQECTLWLPLNGFREGKAICRSCENKRTLKYYWVHREVQLQKRREKNWYNNKNKLRKTS